MIVSLMITESDTAMITQRIVNQSWIIFVGALLGSVFGLMGTFASFMGLIENFSERLEKRNNAKTKLRVINDKRDEISSVFQPAAWKRNSIKVMPIDTLPNTLFL